MVMNSSDEDDDDIYTNAAARLKALKAMKPIPTVKTDNIEVVVPEVPKVPEIPVIEKREPSPIPIVDDPPVISRSPVRQTRSGRVRRLQHTPATISNVMTSPLVTIDLDALTASPSYVQTIDDDAGNVSEIIDCDLDTSTITDDDYMMDVKVRWRSREIERIKLGMNEKFVKIFEYFASLENVPENQIILTRRDTLISHIDTPASINLQIIDILEGGIVDTPFANNTEDAEPICKIKIQSSSSTRNFLSYDLGRSQPFSELFEYCSKQRDVPLSKIKLSFDGELVSSSDTPDGLDLDDEACFDLQIIES